MQCTVSWRVGLSSLGSVSAHCTDGLRLSSLKQLCWLMHMAGALKILPDKLLYLVATVKSVLTSLCKRPLTPATEPGEGTLHGAGRYTVTSAEVAGLVITPSREDGGSSVFSCLHLPSKYSRPYRACLSKLQQNPWLMLGLFHTWLTGFSKCEVFLYN